MLTIAGIISTDLFALYMMKRFITMFFGLNVDHKKQEWMLYGLFFILMGISFLFFRYPPLMTAINLVMLYMICRLYEGSQKKKILVTFLIYSVCMGCEVLAMYSCGSYDVHGEIKLIAPFITVFLVSICQFIIERFLVRHREAYYIPHCNVLILVPVVSIGLLLFLVMSGPKSRSVFISVSLCILLINFLIYYLCDALMEVFSELEDKLMFERLAAGYANQCSVMIQSEEKVRTLRHDMKHHLNELLLLAERDSGQEIRDYILNMRGYLENPNEYISSGNKGVDSLLNYMLQEAERILNKVDYKISVPGEMGIGSFDLNVIVGNLLDNAIFAASHSEEKWMSVSLSYEKGLLFIRVRNSYDTNIRKSREAYETTGKEPQKHGIGLQNVKKAVEHYCGSMQISDTDNIFDVKVMLYTLKKKS